MKLLVLEGTPCFLSYSTRTMLYEMDGFSEQTTVYCSVSNPGGSLKSFFQKYKIPSGENATRIAGPLSKKVPRIVRASEVQCSLKFRVRIGQRAGVVVEMSGGVQPSLEGSLLPLSELRASAQSNLLNLIDRRPGRKVLVLDPKISGPLALVANIGMLKEHGIEKLYHLEKNLSVADGE